jgi:hypothetical protein
MFQTIANSIPGPNASQFNWQHSRGDIVTAVEQVFSAIKDREDAEMEILKKLWEAVEKIAEAGGEVVEVPILIGAAAAFAPFAAIGAGYAAAAQEIKRKRASIGYAEGLVMGVMMESPDNISDYFWEHSPTPNPMFEAGAKIAQYYYNGGLALGYAHGRQVFAKNLAPAFWNDTKKYLNGTPFGNPDEGWGRQEWIDYYIGTATAFMRGHVTQ